MNVTGNPTHGSPFSAIGRLAVPAGIALLGIVLALPPKVFQSEQEIGPDFCTLDESWEVDMPMRLSRGQHAGRDFVFTYGPLYQVVHAPWCFGKLGDLASTLRFHALLPTCGVAIGLWYLLSRTGASLACRSTVYLLWMFLWPPFILGYKAYLGVILATACGYHTGLTKERRLRGGRLIALSLWTLAAPLLTLYSFDLGLITGLALLAFLGAVSCWTWGLPGARTVVRPWVLRHAAMTLIGIVVFSVAVSLSEFWPQYLKQSWEIAQSYTAMMAIPFGLFYLIITVIAVYGSARICWFAGSQLREHWREGADAEKARILALLAAACFSLVWLRYPMTRSDQLHLKVGLVPIMFVAGCLLPCHLQPLGRKLKCFVPVIWTVLVVLSPSPIRSMPHRLLAFRLFDAHTAHVKITHPLIREAVAAAEGLAGDTVFVWPYENIVALAAGKTSPAYTLQSYVAQTPRLEQANIDHLQDVPGLPVILVRNSWRIDQVQNLTRTSLIFRYLLENYTLQRPGHKDFLVLQQTPERAQDWSAQPLAGVTGRFTPGVESAVIELPDESAGGCRASDLLLLRIRVAKTPFLGIGKPGQVTLTFRLSNGQERKQMLALLPDGQEHEVLVSACTFRDRLFLSAFHPSRQWRTKERVVGLNLEWKAGDILSRRPAEIAVDGVAVLRRAGAEIVETSLADQGDAKLWNKFFRGDSQSR